MDVREELIEINKMNLKLLEMCTRSNDLAAEIISVIKDLNKQVAELDTRLTRLEPG